MPFLLRQSTPVARKAHHCMTCPAAIQPGEKYDRAAYIGDDGVYEWIVCLPCAALTNDVWLWAGRPDEGVMEEDFREWATENADDPAAAAFLTRCKGATA